MQRGEVVILVAVQRVVLQQRAGGTSLRAVSMGGASASGNGGAVGVVGVGGVVSDGAGFGTPFARTDKDGIAHTLVTG